jgi:hypothetical protein
VPTVRDTALDNALTAINASVGTTPDERTALIAAKCRGLMRGYDARWRDVAWETVSVEEEFHLPIINPETGRPSRSFTQAGKYDGIIRYRESGKTYLLEHKTTSEDLSDVNSPYMRQLAVNGQVNHYMTASWQSGLKLDGTIYDCIRKPAIRPRKITVAEQKVLATWGTYYGVQVPDSARTATEETPDLYEIRLGQDCIDNPSKYFQRRTIPRLDHDLLNYAEQLWFVAESIRWTQKDEKRAFKNTGACISYSTPCEYLGICSGSESLEDDKWETVASVNPELPDLGNTLNVLTNSRINCFNQCRMKHRLRYELGVRRREEERREALFFGTLAHLGLAAWWLFFKESADGIGDDSAANRAAQSTEELVGGNFE